MAAATTTTTTETAMAATEGKIPNWRVTGDWFDVCKCNIPCPCEFAQTPTYGDCEGILAYNIKIGNYGKTSLDGLNVLAVGSFNERANEQQREALNMIFSGKAGGFMAEFAKLIGEVRGIEYAPIKFELAKDLSYWSAEIPGKVFAKAEALTGPTIPPGKRVQTINPPGSEVGPGGVATWGISLADEADTIGFKWKRKGRSSKHIPFEWRGP
jgi:hypothetical protein